MKNIFYLFLIIITIFFFSIIIIFSCGLPDDLMYFQEPRNVEVDNTDKSKVIVKFYGFNQEEDLGKYLFVGYDIYYYFTTPDKAKKAMVKNPKLNLDHSTDLIDFLDDTSRFPSSGFTSTDRNTFYQLVSIPVTLEMINKF